MLQYPLHPACFWIPLPANMGLHGVWDTDNALDREEGDKDENCGFACVCTRHAVISVRRELFPDDVRLWSV